MDWFLFDKDLRHERVKCAVQNIITTNKYSVKLLPEAYSELFQTSKVERFAKIVNRLTPLTVFRKYSNLDVRHGSECASGLYLIIYFIFISLILSFFFPDIIEKKLE